MKKKIKLTKEQELKLKFDKLVDTKEYPQDYDPYWAEDNNFWRHKLDDALELIKEYQTLVEEKNDTIEELNPY